MRRMQNSKALPSCPKELSIQMAVCKDSAEMDIAPGSFSANIMLCCLSTGSELPVDQQVYNSHFLERSENWRGKKSTQQCYCAILGNFSSHVFCRPAPDLAKRTSKDGRQPGIGTGWSEVHRRHSAQQFGVYIYIYKENIIGITTFRAKNRSGLVSSEGMNKKL